MKTCICIVGPPGAGKNEAAEYIRIMYGAYIRNFLEPVLHMLSYCGCAQTRCEIQKTLKYLQHRFSVGILCDLLIVNVMSYEGPLLVIDGIRTIDDLRRIERHIPYLKVLAITAPEEIRFERCMKNSQNYYCNSRLTSKGQFHALHDHSFEYEVPQLIARADYQIVNDGSLENFYRNVESVVKDILSNKVPTK